MIHLLSLGKENPWLAASEDPIYTSEEPLFLELHATAMLCLPSGECMSPDATVCTTLMSALYSSVTEDVVLNRQLMVCLLSLSFLIITFLIIKAVLVQACFLQSSCRGLFFQMNRLLRLSFLFLQSSCRGLC